MNELQTKSYTGEPAVLSRNGQKKMKIIKITAITLAIILFAVTTASASVICVAREEEDGAINIRPAQMTIDGRAAFTLVGGERKCQKVDPGKHTVVARSPNPYDPNDKNHNTWKSQQLKVTVPKRGKIEIATAPISSGPEYVGPWDLRRSGPTKHSRRLSR